MAKYVLNEPQSEAILGALQSDEFCLIQGPPGTGKTTTICGLVKACLAKRARPLADPSKPNEKLVLPKILVCAPSNAAIDEVAHRLKDKVENVLRIGAERTINVAVKDISLDALVDAKLANSSSGEGSLKEITDQVKSIRSQLDAVRNARQEKENALVEIRNDIDLSRSLEDEIRKLKQRRLTLTQQLDKLRDQQRDGSRTLDTMRRRFRMEVLQEADVICSTLSGAAHNVLEMFESFEMVVIDEAAQAIELSSLIPLKYRTKRCVMVGGEHDYLHIGHLSSHEL
jgi:senataxin